MIEDNTVVLKVGETAAKVDEVQKTVAEQDETLENVKTAAKWSQEDIDNAHRRISELSETCADLQGRVETLEKATVAIVEETLEDTPTETPEDEAEEETVIEKPKPVEKPKKKKRRRLF